MKLNEFKKRFWQNLASFYPEVAITEEDYSI